MRSRATREDLSALHTDALGGLVHRGLSLLRRLAVLSGQCVLAKPRQLVPGPSSWITGAISEAPRPGPSMPFLACTTTSPQFCTLPGLNGSPASPAGLSLSPEKAQIEPAWKLATGELPSPFGPPLPLPVTSPRRRPPWDQQL